MIRLGLCCMFRDEPIKFGTTTATSIGKMKRSDALMKLSRLCMENADALLAALQFCADNGIGCFRVNSQILPVKTHPTCGYEVDALPESEEIIRRFKECGKFSFKHKLRTCFHPDQFVVLNSPRTDVVEKSVQELEYQAEVAEWIGADVINIHGGGAYGDKLKALANFARNLDRLSSRVRSRLTVENDDKTYTPADLLPICKATGIPLVYDVHHHRCNSDAMSIEETTKNALATWDREPLFHISSPIDGWKKPKPERHHDLIDITDFPECWRGISATIEVEAKAKEVAVLKLRKQLSEQWLVYIMRCADGSLYTGITNDLERRAEQHNAGTAARYTRSRLPVVCVYWELQQNQSMALKRELAIKALSRTAKETLIRTTNEASAIDRITRPNNLPLSHPLEQNHAT
ncbi:UV DNA damage repair endonuclease UvsE [Schlesneria paludicola]|uniref:UV DNA damage repair endonuclease UvsE n=1 Tax=Schlesneria paludicola TaxID=360056 RepID=UPI00029A1B1A|nr:UV DNA damage repair endonuclease UvsE [Schlesneria paludicola]